VLDAPMTERAPAPEVRGDTRCPRPDEVGAMLGRMLPPGDTTASSPADVAELHEEQGALVIVLRRASGEVMGEKRLPGTLSCTVRAQAAAVAIAALESRTSDESASLLDLPPPPEPPAAPPGPPAVPLPASPAPSSAPTTEPLASPVETRVTAPAVAGVPPVLDAGFGLLGSFDGDLAPGARVEIGAGRVASAWGVSLAALAVGSHSAAVAPGEAAWWRWGAQLSARAAWTSGERRVEGRAGVALTALEVAGRGFSRDTGATLLDPGAVASVRFVTLTGRGHPWTEVGGAFWPREHDVSVSGADSRSALPRGELIVAVGASFGGRR
jgi:hypothetical protein